MMITMRTPTLAYWSLCFLLLSSYVAEIIATNGSGGSRSGDFSEQTLCDVQQRLDNNCMLEVSQGQSLISCCNRCLSASGCVGASLHRASKKCYLHSQCDAVTGCSIPGNDYKYMYIEKPAVSAETTIETITEMTTETTTETTPEMTTQTTTETITEMTTEVTTKTASEMTTEMATETTTTPSKGLQITDPPDPCGDHGTFQLLSCTCDYGYAGQWCNRYYYDCPEIKDYQPNNFYNTMHVVLIQPPNSLVPFTMICHVSSNEASTYLLMNFADMNFTMAWADYNNYRYDGNLSYWMGLENMRIMLGPAGRLVTLQYYFNDGYSDFVRYTKFRLGDASTNYTLTYSSYQVYMKSHGATPGDCLALSNMTQFSTIDVDNDNDPANNCAQKARAGWWFSTCNYDCNPLGTLYYQTPEPPTVDGYVKLTGYSQAILNNLQSVAMLYVDSV